MQYMPTTDGIAVDLGDDFPAVPKTAYSEGNHEGDTDDAQQQFEEKALGVFPKFLYHKPFLELKIG